MNHHGTRSESDMTANQFGDSGMVSNVGDNAPDKNGQAPITNGSSAKVNGTRRTDTISDPDKTDEIGLFELSTEDVSTVEPAEPKREERRSENVGSVEETFKRLEIIEPLESETTWTVKTSDDRTLNFHEAVRAGDAKCVAAMIARGAVQDLDEPDWNVTGDPPLLVAATNHCLPVLITLLENKCDPTVRSPRGETALHRAILNGGPGNVFHFVEQLLNHGCPASVKEAGGGLTALHILTRQLSHTHIAKSLRNNFEDALRTLELLAKASPVNAKDHQGRSALHILASSSTFDNNLNSEIERIIRILLDAGADPSLPNDRGEAALHESLERGALKTASLLMPHTPVGIVSRYGETPLHIAARKNYVEMVAKLLDHGEDPGLQDAGGNTPLHLGSARGFHQIVSLLVTSPLAQLEKTNNEGLTSLQVATESGFANAVRLLLQAGADPSQTTINRSSTLRHRHPDISILIDHELTRRRQLAA